MVTFINIDGVIWRSRAGLWNNRALNLNPSSATSELRDFEKFMYVLWDLVTFSAGELGVMLVATA